MTDQEIARRVRDMRAEADKLRSQSRYVDARNLEHRAKTMMADVHRRQKEAA
jgi:hypothetical protein